MYPTSRLAYLESQLVESSSNLTLKRPTARPLSRSSRYIQLHRGIYLPITAWGVLSREEQHLAKVLSTHRSATEPPVFSHISAAILHDLPIYGAIDETAHTTGQPKGAARPAPNLKRHRAPRRDAEITEIAGIHCTTVERTLLDLARLYPAEVSLSAVDGFLREEFKVKQHVDWERHGDWKATMMEHLLRMNGARGIRLARQVFELADPRVDSVLESVSHLQLHRMGFAVELQVAVPSPKGSNYYVDFEFLGLDLFGECDGQNKYLDAELRAGLTAEQVVYREKRREEWICSTTGNRMIRWGFPDVTSAQVFARKLQAYGVMIPHIPR